MSAGAAASPERRGTDSCAGASLNRGLPASAHAGGPPRRWPLQAGQRHQQLRGGETNLDDGYDEHLDDDGAALSEAPIIYQLLPCMRTPLLLAPLAALSLCTASAEARPDRRVSFLLAMPSTKRAAPRQRRDGDNHDDGAASRSSTAAAGASSSSNPAKKPRAAQSARVTNGDELVNISRRLHDRLKGVMMPFYYCREVEKHHFKISCVFHSTRSLNQ